MADYQIGRGKPPERHQFKKGESGNPRGRPKGRRSLSSVIQATLRERVVITVNGRKRSVSKLEAAVGSLVTNAMSGDVRALHTLRRSCRRKTSPRLPLRT